MKNLILLEAAFWPTFLAVEKGIVHFMDEGMSSIQGCIIDDRLEEKRSKFRVARKTQK
jgi:hypothetical protein